MSIRRGDVEYILHIKFASVGIKSGIFTGRPPLEFSCLTPNTISDARSILQI